MNGFNVSEQGHVVNLLPPQSVSGGVTSLAFSMKNHKHASIIIALGAEATQLSGNLQLQLADTESSPQVAVAIPFNCYFQAAAGAGNDVLGSIQNVLAAGLALSSLNAPANGVIVIEIDANELESASVGGVLASSLGVDSYLQVVLPSPAAVNLAAIVVVLSGARFANVASPSVTV
jgi:hypothetical protein